MRIDWSEVSADGFVVADITVNPHERVELDGIPITVYYTGPNTPGHLRIYRDLAPERAGRTWLFSDYGDPHTPATGGPGHWHFDHTPAR